MKKLLPGDLVEAVNLAKREVAGTNLLTYGQYREIAQALVQVETELRMLRRKFCPERSQGHVTTGGDRTQCTVCHAYLGNREDS